MKVAIDARDLANVITGVARQVLNLVRYFPELAPEAEFYLYSDKAITVPFSHPRLHQQLLTGHRWLWKQLWMPIEQVRSQIDLFYVPSYSTPVFNPRKSVVTIHDMIYTRHPEWTDRLERWRFATIVKHSARFASRIIAVSETTRRDILELTGISPVKVVVIYPGLDTQFHQVPETDLTRIARRLDISDPFVLYVGSLHHRRNIGRLIQAFAAVKEKLRLPHKLVLSGLNQFQFSELEQWIADTQLVNEVLYFGYVTDEELVALYNLAEIFVFPSLYEGFGLPVLEAMACGTPVVTSNVSSLPEVAGDAAILVDPTSTAELATAIERLLTDLPLRHEMIARGLERCQKFSWRKAAQDTIALFREAVSN